MLQDCIKNTCFSEVEEVVKAQAARDRWKQFFFNRTSRKVTKCCDEMVTRLCFRRLVYNQIGQFLTVAELLNRSFLSFEASDPIRRHENVCRTTHDPFMILYERVVCLPALLAIRMNPEHLKLLSQRVNVVQPIENSLRGVYSIFNLKSS